MPRLRKYRRIIAACVNEPWAILPEKLAEIAELLELRSQGVRLTPDQVRDRIGATTSPGLVESRSRIAVLNVFGTITQRANAFAEFSGGTSTEQLGRAFDQAIADDSVSAIVLHIDSPGGRVPGVEELADRIFAARGAKPIVAVANPVMASAAYWIGSAADEIVAVPSAWAIGSIGAMAIHSDNSEQRRKLGVSETVITSAEFKAELHGPLSDSAREFIQERIMRVHEKFVATVARNRDVSVATVEADFGRGRSFDAEAALAAGMVDRIATLESVLEELGAAPRSHTAAAASAAAISTPPATAAANPNRGTPMNPQILTALIRRGLVDTECSESEYKIALRMALGGNVPEGDEAILKALAANDPATLALASAGTLRNIGTDGAATGGGTIAPPPATGVQNAIDFADVKAMVNLASELSADAKLELIGDFAVAAQAGTLTHKQVLAKIDEKRAEQGGTNPVGTVTDPNRVTVDASEQDKFVTAAREAILVRTWGERNLPDQVFDPAIDDYVEFKPGRGSYGLQSLHGIARQCLVVAGMPATQVMNLSNVQLAKLLMGSSLRDVGLGAVASGPAYNVSGMFSNLMLDAQNMTLRRSYDDTRVTYDRWMRRAPDVPDFKDVHRVIAGELGDPKAVPENGEIREVTLSDSKEKYQLTVWGSIVSHSWQLLVNDRLDAFMEMPTKMGSSIRRKENRLAYQHLKDNGLLADTGALFNATAITTAGGHNNLTTGAISTAAGYVTALNTMQQKMGEQKGLDSDSAVLNLMMRFLLYPPALRGDILQLLRSTSVAVNTAGNSGTVNIWEGALEPIEEGELGASTTGGSDTAFYGIADSNAVDTIEYANLQGFSAPRIEMEEGFDRLTMRRRIYKPFAVKAIDFRGMQKHSGA